MSSIPEFIDFYHIPDGEHKCTMLEIEERFVSNDIRQGRWSDFQNMLDRMINLGLKPKTILINGSFVTGREEPGDVDFAVLIEPNIIRSALLTAMDDHDRDGINMFINPYLQGALRNLFGAHMLIADNEQSLSGWSSLFRKGQDGKLRDPDPKKDPEWVKRPNRKGILRVEFT